MIIFNDIEYANFLACGNTPTKINLNDYKTTIVTGTNGNGKSTFLDALVYCLFGKPFRKVKLGQLVNNINEKGMKTTCNFSIGKVKYKIVRGMKPAIFEIYADGELIPQPAATKDYQEKLEDDILQLNYKSFTQIIILGSASFVPFMQLQLGFRREIIENILDIGVFTKMNDLIKSTTSDLKAVIADLKYQHGILKERYTLKLEFYNSTLKGIQDKKEDLDTRIKDYDETIAKYEKDILAMKKKIGKMVGNIDDMDEIRCVIGEHEDIILKKSLDINRYQIDIKFYEGHDQCSQCDQVIEEKHKAAKIKDLNQKIKKNDIDCDEWQKRIDKLKVTLKAYHEIFDDIQKLNIKLEGKKTGLKFDTQEKIKAERDLKELDLHSEQGEEQKELEEIAEEIKEQDKTLAMKSHLFHYYGIVQRLLKDDGVKTKIINQYLPMINNTVNKYLNMLDFPISFNFDANFNEKISSRHRSEFTYHSFSEGEKSRIDLALLFTWREVALKKSRNATNLLIFDEIFDGSLDGDGVENFMNIITSDANVTNVFVISHKDDTINSRFDQDISFEKRGNFSYMEKIV